MTVAELIAALREHDPELQLYVRGYEGGLCDLKELTPVPVVRDINVVSWYGPHDELDDEGRLGGRTRTADPASATPGLVLDS